MPQAVIVDAVRTATGKRYGSLSGWHPADLLALTLDTLVTRVGLDPALVDDVITGCVNQVGAQALNIGRSAVLAAGWPETIPATTIDRQCGSSQQAAHFAAQGVIAGAYDIVIAAGVENMTLIPMRAQLADPKLGPAFGPLVDARYADVDTFGHRGRVNQGISAELIAAEWGFTRDDVDEFAARSQQRAAAATEAGRFDNETLAVEARRIDKETGEIVEGGTIRHDEGIRAGTTAEVLGRLRPSFLPEGVITAGNSSQISDGASALLIMSEEKADALGLRPRARFHSFAVTGVDPIHMLTGPIPATTKVLERGGLTIDDIDAFEVNEAFASVVLAWQKEHKADWEKVNPLGGAIALGHPLGASGGRLMSTLLNHLERTGGRYGLQTMCEGGGLANATVIERL
jgi:acetyl-CoA acyltransferase